MSRKAKTLADPRQENLFDGPATVEFSPLEKEVHSPRHSTPISLTPYNFYDAYGMNRVELTTLKSLPDTGEDEIANITREYLFLKKVLLGMQLMMKPDGTYGLPHGMMIHLHPAESMVCNEVAYDFKSRASLQYHPSKEFSDLRAVILEDFANELRRYIDFHLNIKDGFHAFRVLYNKKYTKLHSTPVKARVHGLPEKTSEEFLDALRAPYKHVADPNVDCRFPQGGIRVYREQIGRFMEGVYERNLSKPIAPPVLINL